MLKLHINAIVYIICKLNIKIYTLQRNKMRKIFTFLVVLLTALSINAAEFREIKDISGDIVKVPANIEKIATLWYANNQIVLMLGGLIR